MNALSASCPPLEGGFPGAYGEWTNPAQLMRAVQSIGRRIGYSNMAVRSLRHFRATVTLQSGHRTGAREQASG